MESRMIYICSPYAGNTEENIAFARQACGYAIRQGAVPLAPHLLYPQILNDSVPEERETGIRLGLEMLERCEEAIREGPDTSQSHQKNVQFGM